MSENHHPSNRGFGTSLNAGLGKSELESHHTSFHMTGASLPQCCQSQWLSVMTLFQKPFACDVDGCGRSYARSEHLKRHTETAHSEKPSAETFRFVRQVFLHCGHGPTLTGTERRTSLTTASCHHGYDNIRLCVRVCACGVMMPLKVHVWMVNRSKVASDKFEPTLSRLFLQLFRGGLWEELCVRTEPEASLGDGPRGQPTLLGEECWRQHVCRRVLEQNHTSASPAYTQSKLKRWSNCSFSGVFVLSVLTLLISSQCPEEGCFRAFQKRHQLRAHAFEHQGVLPFQWVLLFRGAWRGSYFADNSGGVMTETMSLTSFCVASHVQNYGPRCKL